MEIIGQKIKELRLEKGLTQNILAKDLKITRPALGNYEAGNRPVPSELVLRIANYFNVTPNFLFGLEDL